MAIFQTIIKAAAGAFGHWQSRIAFGDRLATERCSGFSHLEVDDVGEAGVVAAFAGKLSTRQPTGLLQPSEESIEQDVADAATLTLYLEASTAKVDPEWQALSAAIARRFESSPTLSSSADGIGYLVYRNIDMAAAKAALCQRIKTRRARPAAAGCDDALWRQFVSGQGQIAVQAGDVLGLAGPPYLAGTPANRWQCAVGLRTRFGMFDLGTFYSAMTSTSGVQPPADAAALAARLGPRLPLIDAGLSVDAVGADRLWPWPALVEYKRTRNLPYSQWRRLGDLQKQKYRAHLLARVRPGSAPPNTLPFDFDVDDIGNVFQLEAVVEFYMNLREPWNPAAQPVPPGASGYESVNLLSMYGTSAQVAGAVVRLDDALDMTKVTAGRDTLYLEGMVARPAQQYRVMDVAAATQEVTVDVPPQPGASGAWRLYNDPALILIDAFGSRVRGSRAVAGGTAQSLTLEALSDGQLADLVKVNPYDTIWLSASGESARISKAPTIDRAARTARLTLDRAVAPGAGSPWTIPAGVGGVQGFLNKKPTSAASAAWGWDHYDGMMFLVAGGEVRCVFPWSSYTSRMLDPKGRGKGIKFHSSIKGNRRYYFASVFSRNLYINVAFSVIDPEGVPHGARQVPSNASNGRRSIALGTLPPLVGPNQGIFFSQPTPPRVTKAWISEVNSTTGTALVGKKFAGGVPATATPYWILAYDGVRDARFYFKTTFDSDTAPAGTLVPHGPDALGKGGIRIHLGGFNKNGSQGCQVSPYFMRLRMALIDYHKEANQTYYAEHAANPHIDRVPDMHTDAHKPPLIQDYETLTKELTTLQAQLKSSLADPLGQALAGIARSGSDDEAVLEALQDSIAEAQARLRLAEDAGDEPSEDLILPVLATLTELAADEDVVTAVAWAREHQDTIAGLKRRIGELSRAIADEEARWGWNDAMQGIYWVIRPDERWE